MIQRNDESLCQPATFRIIGRLESTAPTQSEAFGGRGFVDLPWTLVSAITSKLPFTMLSWWCLESLERVHCGTWHAPQTNLCPPRPHSVVNARESDWDGAWAQRSLGSTGSAMSSVQENSVRCGPVPWLSRCPLPLTGTGARPFLSRKPCGPCYSPNNHGDISFHASSKIFSVRRSISAAVQRSTPVK